MPVLFVAKRELGRVPFLGWFLKAMGMVLVDRADRKGAARSVAAAAQRLRQGWSLLSFPEGTRSRDGRLQGFKTATFAAAIEAGAPVVPIALAGAGRVLPRGSLRTRPGRIRIAIGEPILTAGLTRDQRADLARRARGAVESLLAELQQGAAEVLRLHRVLRPHLLEQLRREARDAGEAQLLPLGQRVADAQHAVVGDAEDVARPGLLGELAVLRHEQQRVVDGHRLAGADVAHLHAALETAGAEADEGDPVAVLGVHVRLDLEDEAAGLLLLRIDQAGHRRLRAGRRRQLRHPLEQLADAEVVERAA